VCRTQRRAQFLHVHEIARRSRFFALLGWHYGPYRNSNGPCSVANIGVHGGLLLRSAMNLYRERVSPPTPQKNTQSSRSFKALYSRDSRFPGAHVDPPRQASGPLRNHLQYWRAARGSVQGARLGCDVTIEVSYRNPGGQAYPGHRRSCGLSWAATEFPSSE
jgi:hypothetical protein